MLTAFLILLFYFLHVLNIKLTFSFAFNSFLCAMLIGIVLIFIISSHTSSSLDKFSKIIQSYELLIVI